MPLMLKTADMQRFKGTAVARASLAMTVKLSDVDLNAFDARFYRGGNGPPWVRWKTRLASAQSSFSPPGQIRMSLDMDGAIVKVHRHGQGTKG